LIFVVLLFLGKPGYSFWFSDVDNCVYYNECAPQAVCTSTKESYECACLPGYSGDGKICLDIDECLNYNSCASEAICTNTNGSYTCSTCSSGYSGDGKVCSDIDECLNSNSCAQEAICSNTNGSYTCTCQSGYSGDGKICSDIDECSNINDCALEAICTNIRGSYTCICWSGYSGDGKFCSENNWLDNLGTSDPAKAVEMFINEGFVGDRIEAFRNYISNLADTVEAHCIVAEDTGIPDENIFGIIEFKQVPGAPVTVDIDLLGFNASGSSKRGFHIHTNKELTNECKDAGGHFNPEEFEHAGIEHKSRHCGDLGNIEIVENGVETIIHDSKISLSEDETCYFIGRSIVIHQGEDDLGLGGHSDSKTTGHAGSRIGCCIIEKGSADYWTKSILIVRKLKETARKMFD